MSNSSEPDNKKVALITGGAIRVGRALAEACADLGFRLVIHYNGSSSKAKDFSDELTRLNIEHCLVQCDLSDLAEIEQFFNKIPESFKPVELLVNSAAIFPEHDSFDSLHQNWSKVMTINAEAPVRLIQQLVQQNKTDTLQVINIVDARLSHAQSDRLVYRWSKSLLQQATLDLAKTLAPNVRVNAIALGAILPPPGKGEEHLTRLAQQIPLKQTGNVAEVKQALKYLVQQSFVTGEILRLDGGEFL